MTSISETLFSLTPIGAMRELPRAGTSLENPYVYDSVARDIKQKARAGLAEIVSESTACTDSDPLIHHLEFKRLS